MAYPLHFLSACIRMGRVVLLRAHLGFGRNRPSVRRKDLQRRTSCLDFDQNGVVTVLHRLGQSNTAQLEEELERYAKTTPIALVLPSLYAELERPALQESSRR